MALNPANRLYHCMNWKRVETDFSKIIAEKCWNQTPNCVTASISLPVHLFAKHDGLWQGINVAQITTKLVMAVCCNLCLIGLLFTSLQLSTADSKISDVVYNLSKESAVREPSVFLAIIARNAAHLLPNWLGYIENLDYPKNRISVW